MDRQIEGRPSADYLWNVKKVVPFLKIDKGLAGEDQGARGHILHYPAAGNALHGRDCA